MASPSEGPRVFISHAGEDRDTFVLSFARRLRERGLDVWLDRWEMLPGDSIVDKIFTDGLGRAAAFIIVLSKQSVEKAWVREELNAAVVHRIERGVRLIPVLIDDVPVPESLRSTVWIRIERGTSYDGELDRIVHAVFGLYSGPPVGEAPGHARASVVALPGLGRIDSLIIRAACEYELELGYHTMEADELLDRLAEFGIDSASFGESLEILDGRGYIRGYPSDMGPGIAWLEVSPQGFAEYARNYSGNLDELLRRTGSYLLNEAGVGEMVPIADLVSGVDLPRTTIDHVVELFEERAWIRTQRYGSGEYDVYLASAELRRWLEG